MSAGTHFSANWSRLLKWVSALTVLLLLGMPIIVYSVTPLIWPTFLSLAVSMIILGGCAIYMVRGYTLVENELLIHRLFWDTHIDLGNLREISLSSDELKRSIRLFGNGGVFSFTGIFRNSTLGTYRAYVTDQANPLILKLTDRTIVISPHPLQEFVQLLKLRLHEPRRDA